MDTASMTARLKRLSSAAAQGDAAEQAALGHFLGEGGPRQEFAEARRLLGLAAAQGGAAAQYALGEMHYHGHCGPHNFAEARRLLGLAAAQGHAGAQLELGAMHFEGEGGPEDLAQARRLVGLAAAQGNAEAQKALEALDRDAAETQRVKQQAAADAMMEQMLSEDAEETKAKDAAKNAKSTKSAKSKKARKKGGTSPAVSTNVNTDHVLEAGDSGSEAAVDDGGEAQVILMPVAPSTAAELGTAARPAASEPVAPLIESGLARTD